MSRHDRLAYLSPLSRSNPIGIRLNVESHGSPVRPMGDRLHTLPGGKRLFSFMVGRTARYTNCTSSRWRRQGGTCRHSAGRPPINLLQRFSPLRLWTH